MNKNHKVSINWRQTIFSANDEQEAIDTAHQIIASNIANYLSDGNTLAEAISKTFVTIAEPTADNIKIHVTT